MAGHQQASAYLPRLLPIYHIPRVALGKADANSGECTFWEFRCPSGLDPLKEAIKDACKT
jgi:hypothetical protein